MDFLHKMATLSPTYFGVVLQSVTSLEMQDSKYIRNFDD